jgi:Flp pilus assembly protein TadD
MAQTTTTTQNQTKDENNEWLEQFLNTSDEDLISMTKKSASAKNTEFSVLQVSNIIESKRKAKFLFQNNRYKEALQILEDALKVLPGDIELNFFQAQCLFHLGQIDRVEILLESLLNSDDTHKIIQLPRMFAFCLLKKQNFKKAEKFLNDSIKYYQNDIQLRSMYGFSLEQQNKLSEAENVFSDILTQDPDNANANNSLAYIYFRNNLNLQYALTLAEKALSFEPQNPSFLDTAAMIKFKLGDVNGARTTLQKALNLAPSNSVILEHLGIILEA